MPTLGSHWLVPRLARFRAEHPKIQIALHNRAEPFDMAREGIDVATHFGRKEWIDGALTELAQKIWWLWHRP